MRRGVREKGESFAAFATSSDAQVFAIATVLFVSIAVTAITIYIAINAPIEMERCEFQHTKEVTQDFYGLYSTINMLQSRVHSLIQRSGFCQLRSLMQSVVRSNPVTSTVSIKTMPSCDSFLVPPQPSDTLNFSPSGGRITVRLSESESIRWRVDNFSGNYTVESGAVNVTASGALTLDGPPFANASVIVPNSTSGFDTGSDNTVYESIRWCVAGLSQNTELTLRVRTGNSSDMSDAPPWNMCEAINSSEFIVEGSGCGFSLLSNHDGHRYIQLRVELNTTDGDEAPVLTSVEVQYHYNYSYLRYIRYGSGSEGGIDGVCNSSGCHYNFSGNYSLVSGNVSITPDGKLKLYGYPNNDTRGCIVSNITCTGGTVGFDTNLTNQDGNMRWRATNNTVYENLTWYAENITADTDIILKVRTDMYGDMRHATPWEDCYAIKSSDIEVNESGFRTFPLTDLLSVSKGHRYIQLRIELLSINPYKTPVLVNVSIGYRHAHAITLAEASGTIRYSTSYHDQRIVYENGAVITSQDSGGSEFVHPLAPFNFSFSNVSYTDNGTVKHYTRIGLSLVDLRGDGVAARAGENVHLQLEVGSYEHIHNLHYPSLTISITSDHYRAIRRWLSDTLDDAENLIPGRDYSEPVVDDARREVTVEFYARGEGVKLYLEVFTFEVRVH